MIHINLKQYIRDAVNDNETAYKYIKQRIWFGWYFEKSRFGEDMFILKRLTLPAARRSMCLTFPEARAMILLSVKGPDWTNEDETFLRF